MYYAKNKRKEKVGLCNICRKEKALSWDHVPPKGGVELTPVEMETILQVLTGDKEKRKLKESQNGVKFRTICQDCNSILGKRYDPIINDFAISVGRYLKSTLTFPPVVHHRTKPARLIRGILGHLLAAKIDVDDVVFDREVREFLFNEDMPIPENIHIFYWLYPYDHTVITRDFVMPSVRGNYNNIAFFHTLKSFPIAYLISDVSGYSDLFELTIYRNVGIDEEVEIPIDLRRIEHPCWPDMADKGNFIIGGQSFVSSISALPRKKRIIRM